jgi:hypothetical protein
MKSFLEANAQAVEWTGRWEYQLHSGQDIIGRLYLEKSQGTRALAESANGRWLFLKKWFPVPKVTLRLVDSDVDLAVLASKWREKMDSLEFSHGLKYYWLPVNKWGTECVFADAYGQLLIHFKRDSNPFIAFALPKGHSTGRAKIDRSRVGMPDIPLLTLLGCFLMVSESI